MRKLLIITALVSVIFLPCDGLSLTDVRVVEKNHSDFGNEGKAISITVDASTWKQRGRILYNVEGAMRRNLTDVGFHVVRFEEESHQWSLHVTYREEQGEQYTVNESGTNIIGLFRLDHHTAGPLLEITIRESSAASPLGTPPYLDTLQNFQTNPYYFFLAKILWDQTQGHIDPYASLIQAVKTEAEHKLTDQSPSQDSEFVHTMASPHVFHTPMALVRSAEEFTQSEDPREVPALLSLLKYPDTRVKVAAIKALGARRVSEAHPVLENLAHQGSPIEVRSAARTVIENWTP